MKWRKSWREATSFDVLQFKVAVELQCAWSLSQSLSHVCPPKDRVIFLFLPQSLLCLLGDRAPAWRTTLCTLMVWNILLFKIRKLSLNGHQQYVCYQNYYSSLTSSFQLFLVVESVFLLLKNCQLLLYLSFQRQISSFCIQLNNIV